MYNAEADLLKAVVKHFEPQFRDGIKVMKIRDRYTRGYSDLFFCVNGMLVAVELKDDTGKASTEQLKFIEEIRSCGGVGGVCRTVADVVALVEEAKRRRAHGS